MILFSLATAIHAAWDCSHVLDLRPYNRSATVTYDLSRFQGATPYRHLRWTPREAVGEYDWYFEICGDTKQIPSSDCCDQEWQRNGTPKPSTIHEEQKGYLDPKFSGGAIKMYGPGPAWQVEKNGTTQQCIRCERLGRSFEETNGVTNTHGLMTWGPMSDDNPAFGVYIMYQEGDSGDACPGDKNRKFRVEFECMPTTPSAQSSVLDLASAHVIEYPTCTYTVRFKSPAGCPAECPHRTRDGIDQLCDGHGHCEIDVGMQKPRCFCDFGWTGNDCGTPTTDEIAMSEDRCYPISGGYVKGKCDSSATYYSASKYSDPACTNVIAGPDMFATMTCTDIYGLSIGVECLVENGPAYFRKSFCEVMSDSSNSGSSKGSSSGLTTFLTILILALVIAVGYLVYKSVKQPDLKNFLVLNDEQTTQL